MRSFGWVFLAWMCVVLVPTAQVPAAQSPQDATAVLAAARTALGGEQRLTAVKTLVATGRTRQVRGENLVPIEFEILFEAPDKFLRKDEIPAQESGPTSSGFNGDELIVDPPPPPPPASASGGAPPDAARRARVATLKQDFVRLTLGLFATSFSAFPLTFSHGGIAEAPQGKAEVIDVKGPGNFALRFFVNADTHLPIMASWTVPPTPANIVVTLPGQPSPASLPPGAIVIDAPPPPAATASKEERDKYAQDVAALRKNALATAKPIEHRLYFSEYRQVDGLQLPFRLRRAVAGQTIEETTFDRFRINAKIDSRRFEVRK